MKFILDREKWLRGSRWKSALYDPQENKYCCLGLMGKQLKVPKIRMVDVETPADIEGKIPKAYREIFLGDDIGENNYLSWVAMLINDSSISDKMREYQLKRLFKKYGHEIEFVN